MAFKICLVLLLTIIGSLCSALKIGYVRPRTSLQGGEIVLKSTKLSPLTVGSVNLVTMKVISDKDKMELERVEGFQSLQIFEMEVKQDFPPEFKNLPSIKGINLQKVGISFIKRGIFNEIPVERIHLGFNQISKMEKESFGGRVTMLNLMCNNLETFNPHWFVNISSLEALNMDGNLLTSVEPDLFKPMNNLQVLDLKYNHMASIGKGAFSNTAHYHRLDIAHNHLIELKADLFADEHILLDEFAINSNNLTFLSTDVLTKLTVTGALILDDNPWQCKCWEIMKNWISNIHTVINSTTACVHTMQNYFMMKFPETCLPFVDHKLIYVFVSSNIRPSNDRKLYCTYDGF